MIYVESANQKFCFVGLIRRGVKDQAPDTMDMDTQPQGQQAAVPVFQPQVDYTHTHTCTHTRTVNRSWRNKKKNVFCLRFCHIK